MSQTYHWKQLEKKISKEIHLPTLYDSVESIFNVIMTIYKTRGKRWASLVLDKKGEPVFSKKEQQQYTERFEPHLSSFFLVMDGQKGGAQEQAQNTLQNSAIDYIKNSMKQVKSYVKNSPMDILHYETQNAQNPQNLHLIPKRKELAHGAVTLAKAIPYVGEPLLVANQQGDITKAVEQTLDKVKIPPQTLLLLIQLYLDTSRIIMAVSGFDTNRKILSLGLTLYEFLRGDWKSALLSFMGYYGTTPLLIGQFFKTFLFLFRTMAPTEKEQDKLIFDAYEGTQTLVVGLLLKFIQVTAPDEVRQSIKPLLDQLHQFYEDLNQRVGKPLFDTEFDILHLNHVLSILHDKKLKCSCEFQNIIAPLLQQSNPILQFILTMTGLHSIEKYTELSCPNGKCQSYAKLLQNEIAPSV
jgi:hypothetical protein